MQKNQSCLQVVGGIAHLHDLRMAPAPKEKPIKN